MNFILYVGLTRFYSSVVKAQAEDTRRAIVVHAQGRVLDCCENASVRGVACGAQLSEAKAVLREDGHFVVYQEDDYIARRNEWLDQCLAFCDGLETGMPHEAFIDLTPHPDPGEIAAILLRSLPGPGVTAAIGPAKWIARLAAQPLDHRALAIGVDTVPCVTDAKRLLKSVPTALLSPLPLEHRARLEFLGYRWAREVAQAPHSALLEQFGRGAFLIVETANGRALDPPSPNYPQSAVSERVLFGGPVNDSLLVEAAVDEITASLAIELCTRDMTASAVTVYFERESAVPLSLERNFAKPVAAATPLRVAVKSLWSKAHLSFAPTGIRVLLRGLKRAPRGQKSLLGMIGQAEKERSCDASVRTLQCAFGERSVMRAVDLAVPRRELVLRAWRRATGWH